MFLLLSCHGNLPWSRASYTSHRISYYWIPVFGFKIHGHTLTNYTVITSGVNPLIRRSQRFQFPSSRIQRVNTVRGWISSSYRSVWADYRPTGTHRKVQSKSSEPVLCSPWFIKHSTAIHASCMIGCVISEWKTRLTILCEKQRSTSCYFVSSFGAERYVLDQLEVRS